MGLIGSVGVLTPRAQEAPNQPVQSFRSALDVVTIQASVRDAHGHVVSGLTTGDFEVRDNGQVRPILSLRSDRQSPLSLAILVDMSGIMRMGAKVAMARQADAALRSLLRIQTTREKQEAAMHPAAIERAGYWFRDASVPEPVPTQAGIDAEAERYAVIYPDRAARIRAAVGLPTRLIV